MTATISIPVTEATPAQIDGEIARLTGEIHSVRFTIKTLRDAIETYENGSFPSYYRARAQEQAEAARRELPAAEATLEALGERVAPLHEEFTRRGGWTRYYLVNNANGHVHSSTSCHTCFPTTVYKWLTSESGTTAEELVALAGEKACTACFPWAPVDQLKKASAFRSDDEIARAERDQERAAKLKEKVAKGVTPDGRPLEIVVDRVCAEIKTERACELRIVGWSADLPSERKSITGWEQYLTDPSANIEWGQARLEDARTKVADLEAAIPTALAALAWKRGTTPDEELAKLQAKIDKKIKQGY
jgi:hypothetical protein